MVTRPPARCETNPGLRRVPFAAQPSCRVAGGQIGKHVVLTEVIEAPSRDADSLKCYQTDESQSEGQVNRSIDPITSSPRLSIQFA